MIINMNYLDKYYKQWDNEVKIEFDKLKQYFNNININILNYSTFIKDIEIEINVGNLGFNITIKDILNHNIYFKTIIYNDMLKLYKYLNNIFRKEIRKNKLKYLY